MSGALWRHRRAYASLFRIRFLEGMQYRLAAWAGGATSILYGLIEITVLVVFYSYAQHREAGFAAGLSLRQVVSYVWIGQILFLMQLSLEPDLLERIDRGDAAVDMCRPLDFYWHWLVRTAAGRLVPVLWRGSFVLAAGLLIPGTYGLGAPASLWGLLLTVVAGVGALGLCAAYCMVVYAVRMRIEWGPGPMYMLLLLASVFSGSFLPLQLWPDVLQRFLLLQPFAGYLDIPARLYVGSLHPTQAWGPLLLQWLWIAVLVGMGRYLIGRRLASMTVQGG